MLHFTYTPACATRMVSYALIMVYIVFFLKLYHKFKTIPGVIVQRGTLTPGTQTCPNCDLKLALFNQLDPFGHYFLAAKRITSGSL